MVTVSWCDKISYTNAKLKHLKKMSHILSIICVLSWLDMHGRDEQSAGMWSWHAVRIYPKQHYSAIIGLEELWPGDKGCKGRPML